jgi:hypothetical protein
MWTTRLERFAPLTGVAFLILAVVAFVIPGDTPSSDDSTAKVVAYWKDNDTEQMISATLVALAALALIWFGGSLRRVIVRAEGGDGRLAALAFAGTVVAGVGLLAFASFAFVAADTVGDVPGQVTQTLGILSDEFFFPLAAGFVLMLLASGLAIVRTAVLPAWLGWLAILLAIAGITPIGFFAFLAAILLIAGLGVVFFLRADVGPAAPAHPGSTPPPPGYSTGP